MKYLILLLIILVTSCGVPQGESHASMGMVEQQQKANTLVKSYADQELVLINKFNISSGWLYVYRYQSDTLYVIEGDNKNSPVSLSVK